MLKRSRRLTLSLFNTVRKSRLLISNKAASFRFVRNSLPGRFSVVVSKAISKSAVKRNALRRRVYAALAPHQYALDGILYVKREYSDHSLSSDIVSLVEAASSGNSAFLK